MKKATLIILCLLLFALIAACGFWWLRLSPWGVWNEAGSPAAMQRTMDTMTTADWKAAMAAVWPQEVTPFENKAALFDAAFDAATKGQELTFRADAGRSAPRTAAFLVSAGTQDLCCVSFAWENGAWGDATVSVPPDLFSVAERTVTIKAPAGTAVTLNGVAVGEEYLSESGFLYDDMTALERRFAAPPTAERYEIGGICGAVTAACGGGETRQAFSDGTVFSFVPADAASHSFSLLAPEDAVVTVCGAALSEAERISLAPLPLDVTVPEALSGHIPTLALYEAAGLYSLPEITVTAADGTPLSPTQRDGALLYAPAGGPAADEALTAQVTGFLQAYCRYGAHHFGYGSVTPYLVPETELAQFIIGAQPSLIWINGESVEFGGVSVTGVLPLGEEGAVCRAHVSCTTRTLYETRTLELDYELLCVRQDGVWLIQDMAYE